MKLQHIFEVENTCPCDQNRSATRLYLVLILFTCLPLIGTTVRAAETGEFLEPLLAHSVLILMSPAQNMEAAGTGFYCTTTQRIFLVTAKHVLFGKDPASTNLIAREATLISYGKGTNSELKATNVVALDELWRRGAIRPSMTNDVAVIALGERGPGPAPSWVRYESGVTNRTPNLPIFGFDIEEMTVRFGEIRAGSEAYIVGFPRSLGQAKLSPSSVDPDRPLFRRGIIAGKNPKSFNLVVDAPVYQGNSGGPLILNLHAPGGVEVLRIAGVVTKFVGFERVLTDNRDQGLVVEIVNSGYAIAVPMDPVLDLLW